MHRITGAVAVRINCGKVQFPHELIQLAVLETTFSFCVLFRVDNLAVPCREFTEEVDISDYINCTNYIAHKLSLWGGILFSSPSFRPSVFPSVRQSVRP